MLCGSCEAIAEEIKTAFDPADESLVRVLFQIRGQRGEPSESNSRELRIALLPCSSYSC